jgi:hypothetical protein
MAKANNETIIQAILAELRKGSDRAKILSIIVKKWQKSERTIDRMLKIASGMHQEQQNKLNQELAAVRLAEETAALKRDILTANERKELLTRIARGEVEIPTKEAKFDHEQKKFVMISFIELPNHNSRISAIAELNKMDGEYMPVKYAKTDPSGKSIPQAPVKPPFSEQQLDKIIYALKQKKK